MQVAELDLARWLKPGDRIVLGQACGEPTTLVEALIAQGSSIGGLSAFIATSFSGLFTPETADSPERLKHERIFIVDPIDGTVAFMKSKPWWTVALAVIENGRPSAAVIYAPALDECFEAVAGGGALLNGQPMQASDTDNLEDAAMLASANLFSHPIWPDPWPVMRFDKRNSIAYRMALVGAGAFDAAMALSPKWDWDVAAGALIAEEGGARCTDHLGRPYHFNRPDPRQASLVCAAPALHPLILKRCAPISLPDLL